ncbi:hypothetical protein [Nocardioides currus]|uniref:Secreted protein n=1 Tax=Nocardioides currus TaxID=2133958 RepID=A0A2R7YT75_9ACTN|nr:hypothetical protein [Nocardioides currus]PUA79039.1 hypothetical protein C7S10_21430 [Nocardioides currus]
MTSRTPARVGSALVLTGLLAAPMGVAPAGAAEHAAGRIAASDGTCTSTKLTGDKPIRSKAGKKLGTAQMFTATRGGDLGFCVRITPIKPLRKVTTQALLPHQTFFADGQPSSHGLIGGSGLWRHPFLVTGSDVGTGYSMKATARLVVPGGPSGTAKLEGTLP